MYIVIKLCSMLDEVIECVVYMIKWVCNYIDDVEFFCEDVGWMFVDDLVCVVEVVINVGVRIINIFDIVGYIMLFEFVGIIFGLYECVFNIDKVIIFVYIYDDLGIVVGNLLVVVYVGVCQVEGVMNGIGECVGNCVLEEVIMVIKVCKDIMNVYININYYEIWCISQIVSQICNMLILVNKVIVGSGVFVYFFGIYQDGVFKNCENYEIMMLEFIGLNQIQLNLIFCFGCVVVKYCMEEMGYKDIDYNMDYLYDVFLKLVDKKGQVFDYDLEVLVFINKQ